MIIFGVTAMTNITVLNVSHRKSEPNNFHQIIEKGFGSQVYLFVHFIKPAIVFLDGEEHFADNNACIIYTPGERQEYKHYNGTFVNDFLIFQVDDPFFASRYELPENEIFYIANGDEITWLLETITYTVIDKLIDRSQQTQMHLKRLFEALSNSYVENTPHLKRNFEIKQRFIALRDEMRQNPKGWSVDVMAKRVWFTRSRFTVLYKGFFGVSPNADLTCIRVEHAKKLLVSTDMPVTEVSDACGYKSVEHFIRTFDKQAKTTPLQYRKTLLTRG